MHHFFFFFVKSIKNITKILELQKFENGYHVIKHKNLKKCHL